MTCNNLSIDVIEQSNLDSIDYVLTDANDNPISLNSNVYILLTISCYTKEKNGWVRTYNSHHSIQTSQSEIEKHDGQDVELIFLQSRWKWIQSTTNEEWAMTAQSNDV